MLDQFKSPEKPQIDVTVKLTPEEKMLFKEAQEMDPQYLDANRKLEESLRKFNGSKFRFNVPTNKNKSGSESRLLNTSNEKDSIIDASVVNLNSSHDLFDEMVAAKRTNKSDDVNDSGNRNQSFTDKARLSPIRLDKSLDQLINGSKTSASERTLPGSDKQNRETSSVPTAKPPESVRRNNKFVFRTAIASKQAANHTETKAADSERSIPSLKTTTTAPISNSNPSSRSTATVPKSKTDDHDKYDVDAVLKELSYENHLPIGANRTRPNSPLKNTHEPAKKSTKPSTVRRKDLENDYDDSFTSGLSSSTRRISLPSATSISTLPSSPANNTVDMTCKETTSKTGFENLPNILNRISSSAAVKTTSNVSFPRQYSPAKFSTNSFTIPTTNSQPVPHWKNYRSTMSN